MHGCISQQKIVFLAALKAVAIFLSLFCSFSSQSLFYCLALQVLFQTTQKTPTLLAFQIHFSLASTRRIYCSRRFLVPRLPLAKCLRVLCTGISFMCFMECYKMGTGEFMGQNILASPAFNCHTSRLCLRDGCIGRGTMYARYNAFTIRTDDSKLRQKLL